MNITSFELLFDILFCFFSYGSNGLHHNVDIIFTPTIAKMKPVVLFIRVLRWNVYQSHFCAPSQNWPVWFIYWKPKPKRTQGKLNYKSNAWTITRLNTFTISSRRSEKTLSSRHLDVPQFCLLMNMLGNMLRSLHALCDLRYTPRIFLSYLSVHTWMWLAAVACTALTNAAQDGVYGRC